VGVDPGRLDVLVAQQFLDRADVIVAFQQVGGEGVGLEARSAPSGPSRSWRSTWRYRNRRALRAWFCVEAEVARERDLWVLSDEIYARLAFDGRPAPSIASLPGMRERTIICDGFSKTYAMTGWRLGYGIMPEALAERVELLLTHSIGCTAAFTQQAGLEALQGPQGAFYVFPNVKACGRTSSEVADYLLEEAGVAVLPGSAFGAYGEGYVRLCFANSMENIEKALERMAAALGSARCQRISGTD